MSEIALVPGDKIKAQVTRSGNKLILKTVEDLARRFSNCFPDTALASDKVSEMIVMSLVRSDLKVTQDNILR